MNIKYSGVEYKVIDSWKNNDCEYFIGKYEDYEHYYIAKVIDNYSNKVIDNLVRNAFIYEIDNIDREEVENIHLNYISEIDINNHFIAVEN